MISVLIFLVSLITIIENDSAHFGMQTRTITSTTRISASPKFKKPTLTYVKLGQSNKSKVYILNGSKHTDPEYGTIKINRTSDKQTTLVTKKEEWFYQSQLNKILFCWSNNNHQLKHLYYTFNVPTSWNITQIARH
ncbi:hypothetical protein IV88_GL001045 [Pediococcus argentinicus]|uniref:Uncharacterized protein n=1 Tax=Pediococcus argentinicus TaxID=480391 RepID=A0A0R2NGJ6_9LACO|nr:hypothetical protein IV88_GL001045 [Pediococcus argentinicus]